MMMEELIDGLEIYTVGRLKKSNVQMTVEELQNFIDKIKVLEQTDCISRQAALEPYQTLDDNDTISVWLIRKNIEQLPFATPTQKVGKWTNGEPICSCCGEDKFKDLDADIWSDWKPKYCPNCGAKMAESEV